MLITAGQIRAARAFVRMDQATLAAGAGISVPTVKRIEGGEGVPATSTDTLFAIQRVLELAGARFTAVGVELVELYKAPRSRKLAARGR